MLLTQTSLFLPVKDSKDCFFQVCGPPITDLQPRSHYLRSCTKRSQQDATEGPQKKRLKSGHKNYNDIIFRRSRFYHGQPCLSSLGTPLLGLHPRHILNRLPEISQDKSAQVRHLSKYIWPKQFHLSNIWSLPHGYDGGPNRFECREEEISAREACKTPKRLPKQLIERLVDKHHSCNYISLLNRHVPSRMKNRVLSQSERSELLVRSYCRRSRWILTSLNQELVSDTQTQPHRPPSGLSDNAPSTQLREAPSLKASRLRSKTEEQPKPRFAELACLPHEVERFVHACLLETFPIEFWGSEINRTCVFDC